jgi:hypothetical protein
MRASLLLDLPLYGPRSKQCASCLSIGRNAGGLDLPALGPLPVLALTGSPTRAGIVMFARLLPAAFFALPAGVAADRWNRKGLPDDRRGRHLSEPIRLDKWRVPPLCA